MVRVTRVVIYQSSSNDFSFFLMTGKLPAVITGGLVNYYPACNIPVVRTSELVVGSSLLVKYRRQGEKYFCT